jgi:hypothetical protein
MIADSPNILPTGGAVVRRAYILGIAILVACSTSASTPAGPAAAAGGIVITIGAAPAGSPGCNTFTPDTATATTGQPVQWRNTTADTVSLEVDESTFLTVPPEQLSFPQTDYIGSIAYGPTSCITGGGTIDAADYAFLTIVP